MFGLLLLPILLLLLVGDLPMLVVGDLPCQQRDFGHSSHVCVCNRSPFLSVCLSFCLSVCLTFCVSVFLCVCLSVYLSGCNICLLVWYRIIQHLLWWVWPSGGSGWPNTSLCLWSGIQMFKFEWKHCSTSLKMTRQTSARGTTPRKELAGLGRLLQHRGGHHHLGQGGQVPADHRVCRQQCSMHLQLEHKQPTMALIIWYFEELANNLQIDLS